MAYKVVRQFIDKDSRQSYMIGDKYPSNVSNKRLEELSSENNALGESVIEEVKETKKKAKK